MASPNRGDVMAELAKLPLSHDLLAYYRARVERAEQDYLDAMSRLEDSRVDNDESHALRWECTRRAAEIQELQIQLSDAQTSLFDERRQMLRVVAENDELKIQELRDRRKIRYLLSITSSVETGETTYLRPRLAKNLVKAPSTINGDTIAIRPGVKSPHAQMGLGYNAHQARDKDCQTTVPRIRTKSSPTRRKPIQRMRNADSDSTMRSRTTASSAFTRPLSNAMSSPTSDTDSFADSPTLVGDSAEEGSPEGDKRVPSHNSKSPPPSRTTGPQSPEDPDDLVILEDENEALKLTVVALRAQLEEQRESYESTIHGLHSDRLALMSEHQLRTENLTATVGTLTNRVHKLRTVARDATRELLSTKRWAREGERRWKEEKAAMVEEIGRIKSEKDSERRRGEEAERAADTKYSQMHATLLSDLRAHVAHLEASLAKTTSTLSNVQGQHTKVTDALKQRVNALRSTYNSLRRRREYEIEGFRSDIVSLRNKVRELERHIGRWAGLEGKEAELLEMARETGRQADKISTDLHGLKAKVYDIEDDLRNLRV
ncbi:Coiled-coil domain-containing protein 77 [Gonapodya sp. JEL0774]|nr:Coiled-coil domain-containing protein 77 [Gonapodya sp. JEL0774]